MHFEPSGVHLLTITIALIVLLFHMHATNLASQFIRTNGKQTMATVLNMSLDISKPSEYAILGAKTARCLHNGQETLLTAREEGGYGVFSLPQLLPFETVTLLAE